MRLYLVGMMGSGKTFLGKKIALIKNIPFVDLDVLIEDREGMSVAEIFESKGEDYFRGAIECKYLRETDQFPDAIIATGGGTPAFYNNMEWINKNGTSLYLKTSRKVLVERLYKDHKTRPLLKGVNSKEEFFIILKEILNKRESYYLQAEHVAVTDRLVITREIEEVLDNIYS